MLHLPSHLQFEIARFQLVLLPVLLLASRAVRNSLRTALGAQRRLTLGLEDATHALAEVLADVLAREAVPGASLCICGELFSVESVLQGTVFDRRLDWVQALILAPLLRRNSSLRQVRVCDHWLDITKVRGLRAGLAERWRRFVLQEETLGMIFRADRPGSDAECVVAAGLLQVRASSSIWRGPGPRSEDRTTLMIDTGGLRVMAKRALTIASRRAAIDVEDCSHERANVAMRSVRSNKDCKCLICVFVLAAVLMIGLRLVEHWQAQRMGFGGALFSQHPLKAMSFADRVNFKLLEAGSSSDAIAGEL